MRGCGERAFGDRRARRGRSTSRLPGRLSWISAAPAATPRRASSSVRQLLSSRPGSPQIAASCDGLARRRRSAATASPRKRTLPSASTGWSAKAGMMPKRLRPGMSAAVSTRDDAGMPLPRRHRDRRTRSEHGDAASGRRSTSSASAGKPSAPKLSRAVDLGHAVERAIGGRRPPGPLAGSRRSSAATCRRRIQHRVDDLAIAGAAAEHAAQRVLDLVFASAADCVRSSAVAGDQHARRADAALRRAMREEGGLQRRQACRWPSPSTVRTARPAHLADRDQAGADRLAVEQHRAGAAIAGVAADLGAGEAATRRAAPTTAAASAARRPKPAAPLTVKPMLARSRLMPRIP